MRLTESKRDVFYIRRGVTREWSLSSILFNTYVENTLIILFCIEKRELEFVEEKYNV